MVATGIFILIIQIFCEKVVCRPIKILQEIKMCQINNKLSRLNLFTQNIHSYVITIRIIIVSSL